MTKLTNLDKIIYYVEEAYNNLNYVEQILEEGTLSVKLEERILETREELDEILGHLNDRIEELEKLEDWSTI